jgi:hypothetical protein
MTSEGGEEMVQVLGSEHDTGSGFRAKEIPEFTDRSTSEELSKGKCGSPCRNSAKENDDESMKLRVAISGEESKVLEENGDFDEGGGGEIDGIRGVEDFEIGRNGG